MKPNCFRHPLNCYQIYQSAEWRYKFGKAIKAGECFLSTYQDHHGWMDCKLWVQFCSSGGLRTIGFSTFSLAKQFPISKYFDDFRFLRIQNTCFPREPRLSFIAWTNIDSCWRLVVRLLFTLNFILCALYRMFNFSWHHIGSTSSKLTIVRVVVQGLDS